MNRRESLRVLALAVAVVIACVIYYLLVLRPDLRTTPEERIRQKAAELQEKLRERAR